MGCDCAEVLVFAEELLWRFSKKFGSLMGPPRWGWGFTMSWLAGSY